MVSESCIYIRMPGLSQLYVNPTFSFFERQRATGSKKRRQSTTKKRKEIIARKEIYNTSTASLTRTRVRLTYIYLYAFVMRVGRKWQKRLVGFDVYRSIKSGTHTPNALHIASYVPPGPSSILSTIGGDYQKTETFWTFFPGKGFEGEEGYRPCLVSGST